MSLSGAVSACPLRFHVVCHILCRACELDLPLVHVACGICPLQLFQAMSHLLSNSQCCSGLYTDSCNHQQCIHCIQLIAAMHDAKSCLPSMSNSSDVAQLSHAYWLALCQETRHKQAIADDAHEHHVKVFLLPAQRCKQCCDSTFTIVLQYRSCISLPA